MFCFFKQKTAYELRISNWSSDVCSSDLAVGRTEDEARRAGHRVTVASHAYGDTAYGWALEDTTGICKVVADQETGLILGTHIQLGSASCRERVCQYV